jgi:transcriptional regulator with XRE-family HTH domain
MQLTGNDIRHLRQRLGWSLAEMARQMGCTTELVTRWESGSSLPESDSLNHLRYLHGYVENNCEMIRGCPVAETHMEAQRLSQCTNRDLLKDN